MADSGDEIRVDAESAEVVAPEPKVCLEKEESGINILNEVPLVRTGARGNALVRTKEKVSAAAPSRLSHLDDRDVRRRTSIASGG